jgi:hypothetical protein
VLRGLALNLTDRRTSANRATNKLLRGYAAQRSIGRRTAVSVRFKPSPLATFVLFALVPSGLAPFVGLLPEPSLTVQPDLLPTLWQVQGALVGFALAVTLFVYEALGRRGTATEHDAVSTNLP